MAHGTWADGNWAKKQMRKSHIENEQMGNKQVANGQMAKWHIVRGTWHMAHGIRSVMAQFFIQIAGTNII